MFGNYQDEYQRKKATLALLLQLAKSDNNINWQEDQYLQNVAKALLLTEEDLEAVKKDPKAFWLQPPTEEKERMTILYYLLFLMRVDGQIRPEEERLCHIAGFRLGFNQNLVNDLIGVMKTYLKEDVPPNIMLEKIKAYLN